LPFHLAHDKVASASSVFSLNQSGDVMETMTNFFEWINRLLGVSGPGELVMHPVFLGFCVLAFVYAVVTRMKYFAITLAGLMGGAVIFHYLYPAESSNLGDLVTFIAAMGAWALLLVYLGFVRD
jgi:hypothetical protein